MSFLSKLFGKAAAQPIEAIGNVIDAVTTSDEERAQAKILLEKIRQQPHILQAEISKVEAQHRTLFVAGWRPAIGWVCAAGLAFPFLINPIIQWVTGQPGPQLPTEALTTIVFSLLGLGSYRMIEKLQGKAK